MCIRMPQQITTRVVKALKIKNDLHCFVINGLKWFELNDTRQFLMVQWIFHLYVCVLCHTDGQGAELVLDHIVERKRMDDLSMSIIDGRFAEQKVLIKSFYQFRLSNCGIHHVVYLIEEFGRSNRFSIPASSLNQAITNTQVCGFSLSARRHAVACLDLPSIILEFYNS